MKKTAQTLSKTGKIELNLILIRKFRRRVFHVCWLIVLDSFDAFARRVHLVDAAQSSVVNGEFAGLAWF